jgi:hypothetical protein
VAVPGRPRCIGLLRWKQQARWCYTEGGQHHPQSLREWEPFRVACGSGQYIVTDPDVVPAEDCPADWVDHLNWLLDQYPHEKAGLALRLDRIPEVYQRRDHVLAWERQFWEHPLADGVYRERDESLRPRICQDVAVTAEEAGLPGPISLRQPQ